MSLSDHQQQGADANFAWRAGSSSSRSRTILNAPLEMTTSGKGPKQALGRGKVLAGVFCGRTTKHWPAKRLPSTTSRTFCFTRSSAKHITQVEDGHSAHHIQVVAPLVALAPSTEEPANVIKHTGKS
jgi:hypothetical protein